MGLDKVNSQTNKTTEEFINVAFLGSAIWKRKFSFIGVILIGFVIGLYNTHNFSSKFTASMIVESSSVNKPGASLLAISALPGTNNSGSDLHPELDEMKRILGTPDFARHLDQRHQMLKRIYQGAWDVNRAEWKKPSGYYNRLRERALSFYRFRGWQEPTYESLAKFLSNSVKIEAIHKSSFAKIWVNNKDPDLALFILKTAFYEADENIRQRNIVRVNNRRNYLQKKLNNITHEDQRKVIFSLLEKNENKAMLLDSEGPFVGEVLQKPFVSVYRSEPKMIMLIMPIGVCILIYILTMTIILVFHSEFKRN